MSDFDFLLKLTEGGYLGLTKTNERNTQGIEILDVPNKISVEGIKELENEIIKNLVVTQSDETAVQIKKINSEKNKLKSENDRLYRLISELIHCKSNPQKGKQIIESFCCVATKEVKKEFLGTISTLRLFHDQPVYVICDEETKQFAENQVSNVIFKVDINEDSRERINRRFFKQRFKDLQTFHKTECIFKKMDAISFAMNNHKNTMFIDSDLVFLDEIEINTDKEIVLSPHYSPAYRIMQVYLNGFFNAGFLFCANKSFPKFWRRKYLTDSRFFEQQGMDYISEEYSIDFFDREYNIGWWQHEAKWFEETKLEIDLDGLRVRCFHLHLDPEYSFGGNEVVRSKNEELKELLLDYCIENEKHEVIEILKKINLI